MNIDDATIRLLVNQTKRYIEDGYTEVEAIKQVFKNYDEAKNVAQDMFREAGQPV